MVRSARSLFNMFTLVLYIFRKNITNDIPISNKIAYPLKVDVSPQGAINKFSYLKNTERKAAQISVSTWEI